jgi:outer membrane protein OmpA-like peptidoglycan-associated protein
MKTMSDVMKIGVFVAAFSLLACTSTPPPPPHPPSAPALIIPINQSSRGVELILPDQVLFQVGKADLSVALSAPYLDRMAQLILTKSSKQVLVEGHTDSTGSVALNQKLSDERAKVIFEALVARKVPAERMSAVGLAAKRPVAPNDVDAGRRLNRRTEIILLEETTENLMRGEPANSFEEAASRIKRLLDEGAKKQ